MKLKLDFEIDIPDYVSEYLQASEIDIRLLINRILIDYVHKAIERYALRIENRRK